MPPIHEPIQTPANGVERLASRSGWVQAGVLALFLWYLYRDILPPLVRDWSEDPNFSHGFLVPAFSAFLIWQGRKRLATIPVQPSWFGLAVIAGGLAMLIVGVLGVELFLSRSSLVVLLAGLVLFFQGWKMLRALLFPWGFLLLAIPIPAILFNQITIPLQFLASQLGSSVMELLGVPVLRQGNIIQLTSMVLEVAEACSGIRSLMSLAAVALIYGYFLESRFLPRFLLAVSAVPIAVVANGLRVAGTGILGYYWNPAAAEGFFHTFSGWIVFVISLLMLFSLQALMHVSWKRGKRGSK